MSITLQSTVGGFSPEFMRKLPTVEQAMIAHELEPSAFMISKDRATPPTVPFIGPDLSILIRGDYVVSDATLNRFFALHVIAVPLVLIGLVAAHILALHDVGSNNPDGIEIKKNKDANGRPLDGIPFHPYYTVKDAAGAVVFLAVFSVILFFLPEMGGYFLEYNNFIPADPLKTTVVQNQRSMTTWVLRKSAVR